MNGQDIYHVYSQNREKTVVFIGVLAVTESLLIGSLLMGDPLSEVSLPDRVRFFSGIMMTIILWCALLVQLYCYISHWDKRRIQEQLTRKGISIERFENVMNKGQFFPFRGGLKHSIYVSQEYCIIGERGQYYVVHSRDILKLGLEPVSVGNQKAHRLHVLMRNGDKYTLFMGKLQAVEIAEYLKNALSPS